ncbi:uncharacterized protein H6S33_003740 [Morchella sextelata]|uniref:uncharacterized protein n=1 Tax=Morchella sextelata TaxID=1174677 RepID=UPI001D0511E7|nr:uncharacterized protein H6S33_003740 [Morchella sextelata]KAH0606079.1 hypothetical protein H6S33_003740 [Morchella sextelata]
MGLPTSYQLSMVLMLMLVGIFHICLGSPIPQTNPDGTQTNPNATDPNGLTDLDAGLLGKVAWHPEPKGRGTIGILISCTATYIFCIWTSIHPNIMPETTKTCRTFYKTVLTSVSIVLPPGIMVCAMGELYDACQVLKEWNKMRDAWEKSGVITAKDDSNALGLDGAFFVVMGGFLVKKVKVDGKGNVIKSSIHKRPSTSSGQTGAAPDKQTAQSTSQPDAPGSSTSPGTDTTTEAVYWSILTPEGFIEYAKKGVITPESFEKRDMDDKGKANMIAKIFAFAQALWLIAQAFARWQDKRGLPLSLLEVHVIIQVVCTSVIYACWWKKPLDVSEPLKIKLHTEIAKQKGIAIPDIKKPENRIAALNASENYKDIEFESKEASAINNSPPTPAQADLDSEKTEPATTSTSPTLIPNPDQAKTVDLEAAPALEQKYLKPCIITTRKPKSDLVAVMIKAIFDITKHIYSTKNNWYGIAAVIVEGLLVMVLGVLHIIVALGYNPENGAQFPSETEVRNGPIPHFVEGSLQA